MSNINEVKTICFNSITKKYETHYFPKWINIGGVYGRNNELKILDIIPKRTTVKNLDKYKPGIITMFKNYIDNKITLSELIDYLKIINTSIVSQNQKPTHKAIWFRFFKNDTSVTTIGCIKHYLSESTKENQKHLTDCIEIAISNPKDFQIYFS